MDPDNIRTLEQLRQRLYTLSINLQKLQAQFLTPSADQPLPSWTTINTTQKALAAQLQSLQELLSDESKSKFLHEAHAYPTSGFPRAEEVALNELLRKRLAPDTVNWQNKARQIGAALDKDEDGQVKGEEWDELWSWAAVSANEVIKEVYVDDDDEDEDDGDDEDDEEAKESEMKVDNVPPLPLTSLMQFASIGVMQPAPSRPGG